MPPKISVIVPCFNEESTIAGLLEAISNQSVSLADLEVVIADGMSTDKTRQIIEQYTRDSHHMSLYLIDNPLRIIPAALNRAIEASKGDFVVRLDAHSAPIPDYVERCLTVLEETGAANVGGVWEIQPGADAWIARAIAVAAAHPLGAGDARYRISGEPGPVDTVPFGAFRREWLEKVGPFNEELLTNEDYEYNVRLRKAGGVVWFDPSIRSIYFARPDLRSLARQYWRYGYWKVRMLRLYPGTLRWRQALPPIFVLIAIGLGLLSLIFPLARLFLSIQLGIYFLTTFTFALLEGYKQNDLGIVFGFPISIWTMHIAWGSGFLWSLLRTLVLGGRINVVSKSGK